MSLCIVTVFLFEIITYASALEQYPELVAFAYRLAPSPLALSLYTLLTDRHSLASRDTPG
jgi:hypothetical protein